MKCKKLRIFVSSVQKELENERLTVLALMTTDPFLLAHCEAVLYEQSPASPEKSDKECLRVLDGCDVCLSIRQPFWSFVNNPSGIPPCKKA
ncbi:MAG: DUF4062 domain-containing protein [Candidatus Omnitrophica bacterium]|nr:DUF4062 domain-containing protein [Candidatus Omnitrophota bacterium]